MKNDSKKSKKSNRKSTKVIHKSKSEAVKKAQLPKVDIPVKNPENDLAKEPKQNYKSAAKVKNTRNKIFNKASIISLFATICFLVLLTSTIIWSYYGAKFAINNADQLVDPRMFQNWDTFKSALFPGAHTFIIKWPVFYLVKLYNFTDLSFIIASICLSLITITGFAYIIYKIVKDKTILGLIFLSISSVLLFVPSTPYAGALLPVNMSMITTRNLEYLIYIFVLILIIKTKRFLSWKILFSIFLLTSLIASDKYFATISLFGSLICFLIYFILAKNQLVKIALTWLVTSIISIVFALTALGLINLYQFTNIVDSRNTKPYSIIDNQNKLLKSIIYTPSGILTNFGANPGFNTITVSDFGKNIAKNMKATFSYGFIINFVICATGFFCMLLLLIKSVKKQKYINSLDDSTKLSIVLLWSSATAVGAFMLTDHFYPVDARYLTIVFFSSFIAIATTIRSITLNKITISIITFFLLLSTAAGINFSRAYYHDNINAEKEIITRNVQVANIINNDQVHILIGDYWRVLPIKQISDNNKLIIDPLSSCLEERETLTSKSWEPNLSYNKFYYLLSLDKGLTDYQSCTLTQIIDKFGYPKSQILIAGTQNKPKEILLYYDNSKESNNIIPLAKNNRSISSCSNTVMNIIAHQDDDLLFMNPDLQHSIKSGSCIITVYLTAGDDGAGSQYLVSREKGAENAYSNMLKNTGRWTQQKVVLENKQLITVDRLKNSDKATLIFMNLPDGGIHGNGFAINNFSSLQRLISKNISNIVVLGDSHSYSEEELITTIAKIMNTFKPNEIRTQSTEDPSKTFPDHKDHLAVGYLATKAYEKYRTSDTTFFTYLGYPVRELPQNVFDLDLSEKTDTFLHYAKYDGAVCQSSQQCDNSATYGSYLKRQYKL